MTFYIPICRYCGKIQLTQGERFICKSCKKEQTIGDCFYDTATSEKHAEAIMIQRTRERVNEEEYWGKK